MDRKRLYDKYMDCDSEVFEDDSGELPKIDIIGYERDFSMEEDEEDNGWVLFTSGMSDARMEIDAEAEPAANAGDIARRAELVWYVREPDPDKLHKLRWLARFPFIDSTWLGMGHTIPMPSPLFDDSELQVYFFLQPIIRHEKEIAKRLIVDGDRVELLVVHVLTPAEYELKKAEGVNAILDLFDEHDYPLILDEQRDSMV